MKNNAILLPDRAIIEITGKDCEDLMQGLVTNDIKKLTSDDLMYCSMLSSKGRFLYDIFIFKHKNGLFLDVFEPRIDEIIKKLSFYRLKKDVNIVKNDNLKVLFTIDNKIDREKLDYIFQDPRSDKMKYRSYCIDSNKRMSIETQNQDLYEYTRILNKIPESEKDLNYDKSIIVEYGLDNFNAIDYEKGCYIGQELTARTHFRGEVRKKIFLCNFPDKVTIEKNTEIFLNEKNIGIALSSVKYNNTIYGLIFVKNEYMENLSYDNYNLTANNNEIKILN